MKFLNKFLLALFPLLLVFAACAQPATFVDSYRYGVAAEEGTFRWSPVGQPLANAFANNTAFAKLSDTRFAFVDQSNDQLRAYDFNGTAFSLVGSGLNVTAFANDVSLAALSSTRVVLIDETNDTLQAYDFNGSTWSTVGNATAIATVSDPAIVALSSTRIAFIDGTNDKLRAYDFDGTDWAQAGNELAVTTVLPAITALSSTRVAVINVGTDVIQAYDFDGTDWTTEGNATDLNASAGNHSFTALSSTRIAYYVDDLEKITVYDFDGADWVAFGEEFGVPNTSRGFISALSASRIVYIDENGDMFRAFDFLEDGPTGLLSDIADLNVVFELDATLATSVSATATLFKNAEPAPADGAAQTDYDFSVISSVPFTGIGIGSYWNPGVGDYFQLAANTQFLKDLHKTTGGQDFWIAIAFLSDGTWDTGGFFGTASATADGFALRGTSAEGMSLYQNNGITDFVTGFGSINNLFVMSYDHSTDTVYWSRNSVTLSSTAFTPTANTDDAGAGGTTTLGNWPSGAIANDDADWYHFSMGEGVMDDTKLAAIHAKLNVRHGRDYTP